MTLTNDKLTEAFGGVESALNVLRDEVKTLRAKNMLLEREKREHGECRPIEPVTPGPWETSNGPHSKSLGAIGNPKEWRYVQHNFPQAPYEGEFSDEWGIYPPLGEAGPVALVSGEMNAKLISAAPELIEACEGLLKNMQTTSDVVWVSAVEKARAAIKKATTREPNVVKKDSPFLPPNRYKSH